MSGRSTVKEATSIKDSIIWLARTSIHFFPRCWLIGTGIPEHSAHGRFKTKALIQCHDQSSKICINLAQKSIPASFSCITIFSDGIPQQTINSHLSSPQYFPQRNSMLNYWEIFLLGSQHAGKLTLTSTLAITMWLQVTQLGSHAVMSWDTPVIKVKERTRNQEQSFENEGK